MQLVATKLIAPPVSGDLVARPELLGLLDGALSRPVTLVTAPAGFGKTTLVAAWLQHLDPSVRSAWLALDEDDDDPGRFFAYLVAAVGRFGAGAGEAAQTLLRGAQAPSVPGVVTAMVNDLADRPAPMVLVLDDFHAVDDPEVMEAVTFLVERCPPPLHLVVAGRKDPPLPLARWHGRGIVGEVRAADLRFTTPEAAALLGTVTGHRVDDRTVDALNRRAEGWAAGLQMLGIGLRERGGPGDATVRPLGRRGAGDRFIIDYLAREVLGSQPEDVRRFLHATSVLDRFTPALCDAVTGRHDSDQVIKGLRQANLFLIPLDERNEWHRYHRLFADYLRSGLDERSARAAHGRAAAWFAEQGLVAETIKHALAAGDVDLAVRMVRWAAEDQLRNGELAPLLGWLDRLPDEVVRQHADLAGFKGWLLYLRGRMDDAETYARIADERMPPDAPDTDRAMLRTFQAYLALTRGESTRAAGLAGEALDLLGQSTSFFRAAAMGVLGQARRLSGDRQGAIDVLRAAVRLGARSGNPLSTLEATGYLAPLLYVQGGLREAVLLCEDALRIHVDAAGRPLPMSGLVEVPLGTLLYERDELDRAERHLVDGIARCEQLGTTSYTLLGLRTLGRLQLTRGATDEAFRCLMAARRQAEAAEDHRRARLVQMTLAELHLRTGGMTTAARVLAELPAGKPPFSDYEQLTRARLLIAQGHPAQALDALGPVETRATTEGRDGVLIAILAVGALAHAGLGQAVPARHALARAVALAAPEGYRRTFLDEGPALLPLLRQVRRTAPKFVDDLLARSASASALRATSAPGLQVTEDAGVVETLTDTQHQILKLIATGMSNQQVAEKLFITVGTTKWHLNQIFGRLQVRNRTEAVARARELGFL